MFDKNEFKDAFRAWVTAHPAATEDEAREYCQALLPTEAVMQHYWLLEQSLQWFRWLQRRERAAEDLASDDDERLVC